MRLLSSGLVALAGAQFSPNCPYFTEEDWVLVRRAKGRVLEIESIGGIQMTLEVNRAIY